ncbi:unknown [Clostridium sp. CAG:440]|nr:unknown [Clostridium sp. CAG:440]HJJ15887.1 SemiSWEET family transporter [Clostridiaceae bacterium]
MLGDVLLGIVSLCTLVSYLPQAIKLIKTQESNDLSTTSWIIWVVSSFSYLLYAFLCSNEFMLKFETVLEFSFCLLILILTIYYRKK